MSAKHSGGDRPMGTRRIALPHDISSISIHDVVRIPLDKLGRGKWMGRCRFHPGPHGGTERTASLCVRDGSNSWNCFACGRGGTVIDWVVHDRGVTSREAVKILREERGIASPEIWRPVSPPPEVQENDAAKRIAWAAAILRQSLPTAGTPVETYLRSRGIAMPIPASLRFCPNLSHTDNRTRAKTRWPAMVVAMQTADGKLAGVHRTWLQPDGTAKAPIENPKKTLGACNGGAVRLAPVSAELMVAEGIEDCLAAMQETRRPGWAAGGSWLMSNMALPGAVREGGL